jgi:hypothetical protein
VGVWGLVAAIPAQRRHGDGGGARAAATSGETVMVVLVVIGTAIYDRRLRLLLAACCWERVCEAKEHLPKTLWFGDRGGDNRTMLTVFQEQIADEIEVAVEHNRSKQREETMS